MSRLVFLPEGGGAAIESVDTVAWVPRVDENVVLNDDAYKVERVEYRVTLADGLPLGSNPRWVSKEYVNVYLSIVP